MSKRKLKSPNDYPRISVRIDSDLLRQLDEARAPQGLSYGQVVTAALRRHLPALKEFNTKTGIEEVAA